MNLFRTDADPERCAAVLCDQHVVKMPVEAAQLLATAVREHGAITPGLYRATHRGHPCTRWVAGSQEAAGWALAHGLALCTEYQRRFDREHATLRQLRLVREWLHLLPARPADPAPVCVPDTLRHLPIEEAYQQALREKHRAWAIAGRAPRWTAPGRAPAWALEI